MRLGERPDSYSASPLAVLRPAGSRPGRLLSESIALAEAHGSTVTLDEDFSRDLDAIINSHRGGVLKKVENSRFLAD